MTSRSAAAVVCALCALAAWTGAVTRHPAAVVVSFDGFRPDYVRPDTTPGLFRFRDASAAPPYMRPAFPTKTFVNHFTIATGLHAESHGVLDNYMFDRNNETMSYTYEQFHQNEAVVPIWIQNENSGSDRYSGVIMWPGSEFPYQGKTPTYVQKFNKSVSGISLIDKMMSWITDKKKPANLIFAYFDEPDFTGHIYGIGSNEIKDKIFKDDQIFKYLLDKIKQEHLEEKINLIVLSDHGMSTVTYNGLIYLDEYVSKWAYKVIISGPNGFVNPNPGKFDEVYKNLTIGANKSKTFNVFQKNQIPDRWHLKNSPRLTGLIYLVAKPGYKFWDEYVKSHLDQTTKEKFRVGVHGYDNDDPEMRAFFMASGPAFKRNFTALPFDNVDLYPLISRVLGLEELPKNVRPNGTMAGVEQLLVSKSKTGSGTATSSPQVRGILAIMLLHPIVVRYSI